MEFQLRMAVQRSQSGLHAWAIVRVRLLRPLIEVGSHLGLGFFRHFSCYCLRQILLKVRAIHAKIMY